MPVRKEYTPPEWGGAISLRTSTYSKTVQVDDTNSVFSGDGRSDKTGFFRYPEVYNQIIERLNDGGNKRILSLPASVGCEAYSLAAMFNAKASEGAEIEIHMADISEAKLKAAASGIYPYGFHNGILEDYKDYFLTDGSHTVIREDIKSLVKALPAFNILNGPEMVLPYDMVISLNLLCYLPDFDSKVRAFEYMASLTDNMICLTHGTIKDFKKFHDVFDASVRDLGWIEQSSIKRKTDDYKLAQFYAPEASL